MAQPISDYDPTDDGIRPGPDESVVPLTRRVVGAYLGLAVGDALGATTEFMTPSEIRHQYGVHDRIRGGGWLKLKPGAVTDDTEMSLALGDAIIAKCGVQADAVADAFSNWMRTKPVDIGNTVRRGIVRYRSSGVTEMPENEHDAGNGACMRSLPVAIAYWNASPEQRRVVSRLQSHVTHNNPQADAGTECLLEMLVAAFHGDSKARLRELADGLVAHDASYRFDVRRAENPSGWIVETLRTVFQAFFTNDCFESILTDVVNRGGDADTTGAIAGMLAGAHFGAGAIPAHWLKALDADVRRRCEDQALTLMQLDADIRPDS